MWTRETYVPSPTVRGRLSEAERTFITEHLTTLSIADMARALHCAYRRVDMYLYSHGLYSQRKTVKRRNQVPVGTLSREELAYLAGIVDGEGTVSILAAGGRQSGRYFRPVLSVANTSLALKQWLEQRGFYSSFYLNGKGRPCWKINVSGYGIDDVLLALLPYLVIKAPQAALVIEFCQLRLAQRHSAEPTGRMLQIVETIRRLNRRGVIREGLLSLVL